MNLISLDDFAKVELKVGKILKADRIKDSHKLLKLQVNTGEYRQIAAGIGKTYSPGELTGNKYSSGHKPSFSKPVRRLLSF